MILPDRSRRPDESQVVFLMRSFQRVACLIETGDQIKAVLFLRHGLSCTTCNRMTRDPGGSWLL